MISINCLFFRFHTIPLCFLYMQGFYFDAWIWALEAFAYSCWIWVCLHAFYAWFLTYFIGSVLGFHMRCLQSCLDFRLKFILAHSPASKPVDWNMKRGFYWFILFLSFVLCFSIFLCFWYSFVVCIKFHIST